MPKIVEVVAKEGGYWLKIVPAFADNLSEFAENYDVVALKMEDGRIWDYFKGWRNPVETEDERKMRQIAADQQLFINDVIAIDRVLLKTSEIALKYSKRSSTIVDQLRVSLRAAERLFMEDSRRELSKLVNKQAEQITDTMRQIVEDGNNN